MSHSKFAFSANRVKSDVTFRQLIGAEFCASLSEEMISLASHLQHTLDSRVSMPDLPERSTVDAPQPAGEGSRSSPPMMVPFAHQLLQDLSAHYGASALRRGGSKLVGTPYRSPELLRRGHHRKEHVLWNMHKAHQFFCRHCGVSLRSGITKRRFSIDASGEKEGQNAREEKDGVPAMQPNGSASYQTRSKTKAASFCLRCLQQHVQKCAVAQNKRWPCEWEQTGMWREAVMGPAPLYTCQVQGCRRKRKSKKAPKVGKQMLPAAVSSFPLSEAVLQRQIQQRFQAIPKGPLGRQKGLRPLSSNRDAGKTNQIAEERTRPRVRCDNVVSSTSLEVPVHRAIGSQHEPPREPTMGGGKGGSRDSAVEKPRSWLAPPKKQQRQNILKSSSPPKKERTAHDDLLANLGL